MSQHPLGKVYLVGAGPGAADLLTVRAARVLAQAEIVLFDALVGADHHALAPSAEWVPVGKRCGKRSSAQAFINKQMVDAAQKHAVVVRLKGGDPMLFGRAHEEIEALQEAGIAYEVIPGISAAFGSASSLGVSLTQRGISRSVCFLTPAVGVGEASHDWARPAAAADTAVLYMASRQANSIQQGLLAAGVSAHKPIALIENATLPSQHVQVGVLADLPQLSQHLEGGPTLIILGDVLQGLLALGQQVLPGDAGLSSVAA